MLNAILLNPLIMDYLLRHHTQSMEPWHLIVSIQNPITLVTMFTPFTPITCKPPPLRLHLLLCQGMVQLTSIMVHQAPLRLSAQRTAAFRPTPAASVRDQDSYIVLGRK